MNQRISRLLRRRRLIIGGVLLLILAAVSTFVFTQVYDPFAETVDDLLVLVPDDAEFVLRVREVKTFVKGVENREFWSRLHRNDAFQRFLERPDVHDAEAYRVLRDAWREITTGGGVTLPMDLDLVDDLLGEDVVLWGRRDAGEILWAAALQPDTAWAQVGANAVASETLTDWFVSSRLPPGVTVQPTSWGAKCSVSSPRMTLGVARVGRAILVGTDVAGVARVAKTCALEGVPVLPPTRYTPGWAWEGPPGTSVDFMVAGALLAKGGGLRAKLLDPLWGADLAQACERFLPDLHGPDVYGELEIDATGRLRVARAAAPRQPRDPFSVTPRIDRRHLDAQLRDVVRRLPASVFGYAYLETDPKSLVDWVFREPALMPPAQRSLLFDELSQRLARFKGVPSVGEGQPPNLLPRMRELVDEAFDSTVGLVFFDKGRSMDVQHDEPGFAVILRVENRQVLDDFLADLDRAFESPFEPYDWGEWKAWENTRKRWLDDPSKSRPGFAYRGDWFLLTNWFPLFSGARDAERGEAAAFDGRAYDDLAWNLDPDHLEESARGVFFLDPEGLYAHMDHVKDGWVEKRSKITEAEKYEARQRFLRESARMGMKPEERESWEERRFQQWLDATRRKRSPERIRREIDTWLNYFRGAFGFVFGSFGGDLPEFRFLMEMDAAQ